MGDIITLYEQHLLVVQEIQKLQKRVEELEKSHSTNTKKAH